MKLSPSAWISCGTGSLFSPPFKSRCLLYNLYDVNYSLLVYHEQTVRSRYLGRKNGNFSFSVVAGEPHSIYVHIAPRILRRVNDLIKLPSTQIELSKTSAVQKSLGEITFNVEPFNLRMKEMCLVGNHCKRSVEQQIASTPYCIKSSAAAVKLGDALWGEHEHRCWKVSVASDAWRGSYRLDFAREWSLRAVQLDDDWSPSMELCLAKSR